MKPVTANAAVDETEPETTAEKTRRWPWLAAFRFP